MIVNTLAPRITQLAGGLRFPEGPIAMPDGSVILVEIERRTLSRSRVLPRSVNQKPPARSKTRSFGPRSLRPSQAS